MAGKNTEDKSAREEAKEIVDEEFAGLTDDAIDDVGTDADDVVVDDEDEDPDAGEGEGVEDEEELLDDDEPHSDDDDRDDEPGAGTDRGDGRDTRGKFAGKDGKDDAAAADKQADKTDANAGAVKPAAEKPAGEAKADAAPAQPAFAPFKIRANKEEVAIPEAQVTRAGGFVMLAVPENQFSRFEARIGRGVVAEQAWQRIQQRERELEAEKAAPARKSDEEIAAELTLDVLKPHLPDLLSSVELENLELKIKNAQRDYADTYTKDRTTAIANHMKESSAPEADEALTREFATYLLKFRDEVPELKDLTNEELQQAFVDLIELRQAGAKVFWKEGEESFADARLIAKHLARTKATRGSKAPDNGALPDKGNTAAADGTTDAKSDKTSKGEAFNRGVDTAKKPSKTTSLKANRGQGGSRSRDERNTRRDRPTREREPAPSSELAAEEKWRKDVRKFQNSDSLDFDDGEDD